MGSQPALVERTASLYVLTKHSGSPLEAVAAAVLYVLDLGPLLVIAGMFRRYLCNPDTSDSGGFAMFPRSATRSAIAAALAAVGLVAAACGSRLAGLGRHGPARHHIASRASSSGEARAWIPLCSGSHSWASSVYRTRISFARSRKRRRQPRTVSSGAPAWAATSRRLRFSTCVAISASPITLTTSARRKSASFGSSTWVFCRSRDFEQSGQIERRGRT